MYMYHYIFTYMAIDIYTDIPLFIWGKKNRNHPIIQSSQIMMIGRSSSFGALIGV